MSKENIEILYVQPYKAGILLLLTCGLPRWITIRELRKKNIQLSFK